MAQFWVLQHLYFTQRWRLESCDLNWVQTGTTQLMTSDLKRPPTLSWTIMTHGFIWVWAIWLYQSISQTQRQEWNWAQLVGLLDIFMDLPLTVLFISRSLQRMWSRLRDRIPLSSWTTMITGPVFVCVFYVPIQTIVANCYVMISRYSADSFHLTSSYSLPGFSSSLSLIPPLSAPTPPLFSVSFLFPDISLRRCPDPRDRVSLFFSHTHWCCITVATFHWKQWLPPKLILIQI